MKCCHTVSFCLSEKENHNCRNRRITRPRVCCKNINPWNSWQVPAATISTVETDGIAVLRIVIRKIVGPQHKFKVVRGTVRCIKEHRQVTLVCVPFVPFVQRGYVGNPAEVIFSVAHIQNCLETSAVATLSKAPCDFKKWNASIYFSFYMPR